MIGLADKRKQTINLLFLNHILFIFNQTTKIITSSARTIRFLVTMSSKSSIERRSIGNKHTKHSSYQSANDANLPPPNPILTEEDVVIQHKPTKK